MGDALDAVAPAHLDQAMGIDAVLRGILGRHVAVLVKSDLGKGVVDAARHEVLTESVAFCNVSRHRHPYYTRQRNHS